MEIVAFRVGEDELYGEYHAPPRLKKNHGGILLVHGFNSCLKEFAEAGKELAANGFHVLAFDQRGHGASQGERGRTNVARALEDIEAAAEVLRQKAGAKAKLGIVGHSLGGAYAIAALGETDLFSAGVVVHPVDRLYDELRLYEKLGYGAMAAWSRWMEARGQDARTIPYKVDYKHLFVSPEAVRWGENVGFLDQQANLGNYEAAKEMRASQWARKVKQPVLCVLGDQDKVVRPSHSRNVVAALGGPKEILHHMGGHSAWGDMDGERVVRGTAAWMRQYLER